MTPFKRAYYPPEKLTVEHYLSLGVAQEEAERSVARLREHEVYRNNVYEVALERNVVFEVGREQGWPEMISLSIKRIDRRPIRDWRHFQRIKNELVGPEHEGVELYPAESRLVDTANQYYLFVFVDPTIRVPFGFTSRLVEGTEAAKRVGATQRPFAGGQNG